MLAPSSSGFCTSDKQYPTLCSSHYQHLHTKGKDCGRFFQELLHAPSSYLCQHLFIETAWDIQKLGTQCKLSMHTYLEQ